MGTFNTISRILYESLKFLNELSEGSSATKVCQKTQNAKNGILKEGMEIRKIEKKNYPKFVGCT